MTAQSMYPPGSAGTPSDLYKCHPADKVRIPQPRPAERATNDGGKP